MTTDVLMPALSPTMEEGKLAKWHVKEGDEVKSGDVIAEIETDKATMEVEAVDEGVVGKILVPRGHRGREGQHPDRGDLGGRRRCAAAARAARCRRRQKAAEAAERRWPKRRRSRRGPPQRRNRPRADAPLAAGATPKSRPAPRCVTMTVRDALRDAMAEEMRRDRDVFLMGEEVAEYQGAYKVSQGLLQEFGDRRVIDTPITEHGFAGLGVGAAMAGLKPDRRIHDLQLRHAGDRPDHQLRRQDALHVGRPDALPDRVPRTQRRRRRASPPSTARTIRPGTRTCPGLKVIAPYDAADAKGLLKAAIRDPNPVDLPRERDALRPVFDVPELDDFVVPIGKARVARAGNDVTHRRLVDRHGLRAEGRRSSWRRTASRPR